MNDRTTKRYKWPATIGLLERCVLSIDKRKTDGFESVHVAATPGQIGRFLGIASRTVLRMLRDMELGAAKNDLRWIEPVGPNDIYLRDVKQGYDGRVSFVVLCCTHMPTCQEVLDTRCEHMDVLDKPVLWPKEALTKWGGKIVTVPARQRDKGFGAP